MLSRVMKKKSPLVPAADLRVNGCHANGNVTVQPGVWGTNRWFGVNADYRHFVVNAGDREHINRFATGVKVFL